MKDYFTEYPNLVILSGAGLSAESGLNTFRGTEGLWEGHRIEEVACLEAFENTPELVHQFYNHRRAQLKKVTPNAAHHALARLEKDWPGDFLHITQNVDDLNERAGSQRLVHMHGELLKARCLSCERVLSWHEDINIHTECPACGAEGEMRPNIVWFGEMPFHMEELMKAVSETDIFISVGTSGSVYPAAGFAQMAQKCGAQRLIEVNLDTTMTLPHFHELRKGPASIEVPKLVDEVLSTVI